MDSLLGYTGSYCQHEINECDSAPCQNGATCKDLIGSHSCTCPAGFQGPNCEFNINDCFSNPCRNGGVCHDLVNAFSCSCPHGTLGILCEINVNECFEGKSGSILLEIIILIILTLGWKLSQVVFRNVS